MANDILSSIKERLDAMEPEKRQRAIQFTIIGGIAVLMVAMYYLTDADEKKPPPPKEAASVIELGDERLEDDIRAQFSKSREELESQNRALSKKLSEQEEKAVARDAQFKALEKVVGEMAKTPGMGLPDIEGMDGMQVGSDEPSAWERGLPPVQASPAGVGAPPADAAPPVIEYVGDVGRVQIAAKDKSADGSKKKGLRFFLPPSFMPARLLTGLAAKTVESASGDPEPMMLRIQAPAVLPNEVRAQLSGCYVLASGYGSLASERVESRLTGISCLSFEGKSMIDAELKGILVDKDGVKGLAGHAVSKMSTNLARLAFAGAIQGAAAAFRESATTTSVSPLGQTRTIDSDRIGRAAAGDALEKPAEEYTRIIADLVRQQSPVVEVGPGKDVTVVVTEGVWLEVKSYEEGPSS